MAKLLIVEDDPLMVRLYQKIFERKGYEVEIANRGLLALQMAKNKPDLILLDIMMPEMDGFEVLQKLKVDEETKSIPVIALSNLAGSEDAERALKLGAVKYIVKSEHDPQDVVSTVEEALKSK